MPKIIRSAVVAFGCVYVASTAIVVGFHHHHHHQHQHQHQDHQQQEEEEQEEHLSDISSADGGGGRCHQQEKARLSAAAPSSSLSSSGRLCEEEALAASQSAEKNDGSCMTLSDCSSSSTTATKTTKTNPPLLNSDLAGVGSSDNVNAHAYARTPPRSGVGDADDVAPQSHTSHYYGSSYFPERGTQEFEGTCGWTTKTTNTRPTDGNCTVLVRPRPGGNEGISLWSADIVKGYVLSMQAGCRLLIDYGPGVDIASVVVPVAVVSTPPTNADGSDHRLRPRLYDWRTTPDSFACEASDRCYTGEAAMRYMRKSTKIDGTYHPSAPEYRYAYNPPPGDGKRCDHCLYHDSHAELRASLPGFDLETAFACAYANLFRIAPTAVEYEPRLFDWILPAVSDPTALVMALYIRSQQADIVAAREELAKKGEDVPERFKRDKDYRSNAERFLKCAQTLEKKYLRDAMEPSKTLAVSNEKKKKYERVVWVILTDNPSLKSWTVEKYSGMSSVKGTERTVVVTGARGIHTRTRRNPSTAEFAEAFIDWYLIGESDLVVVNGNSFGFTGGLRTARPIYSYPDKCSRQVLIHDRVEVGSDVKNE